MNPEGQIWIATHSIHILSMCAPEDIWLVENNSVRWVGKNPESALRSLMGDEDAQMRLADFLAFPATLAVTQFAAECLGAPPVVMTPPQDPQNNQVRAAVQKLADVKGRLQILDWGAGKGRLAAALADLDVLYHAYEPDAETREECTRNILNSSHTAQTVIADYSQLLDFRERFDIIVLCNVLHEISTRKWSEYFGRRGYISSVLRNDGHLLVLEDYQLPHGELAHTDGFLLLNRAELKALFDADEEEIITSSVQGREERLKAHLIAKSAVLRYSKQGRDNALEELKKRAKIMISDIRERSSGGKVNYQTGREHALWVQLFANASLALEEI